MNSTAARQITFKPSTSLARETSFREGLLLVDVRVGQKVYRLSLDTGAPFTTLRGERCGSSIKPLEGSRSAIRRLGGDSDTRAVTLPGVEIGNKRLESVRALIVTGATTTEQVRDGVIGPKPIGLKALQFDFERHRLSFED